MVDKRRVSYEKGRAFAEQHHMIFLETRYVFDNFFNAECASEHVCACMRVHSSAFA